MNLSQSFVRIALASLFAVSLGCASQPNESEASTSNAIAQAQDGETGCPANTLCVWFDAGYQGSAYFIGPEAIRDLVQTAPNAPTSYLGFPPGTSISSVDNNLSDWTIELVTEQNVAIEFAPGVKVPDFGQVFDGVYNDRIVGVYRPCCGR